MDRNIFDTFQWWRSGSYGRDIILLNNFVICNLFDSLNDYMLLYDGRVHFSYFLSSINDNFSPSSEKYFLSLFLLKKSYSCLSEKKDFYASRDYIESIECPRIKNYLLYVSLEGMTRVLNTTGVQAAYLKEFKARARDEFRVRVEPFYYEYSRKT